MSDPLRVPTPAGSVRGVARADGGVLFAGIPFAAPPVGQARLRPPQPVSSWAGVRDAAGFPPPPLQDRTEGSSEDCLYLNVWTPSLSGRRPVVVWLYGGGFETGSASPPTTNAAALSRRADVVVVAANYRVGALGFLHAPDVRAPDVRAPDVRAPDGKAPDGAAQDVANLGLQDQIAALRWTRQAVRGFGGDPENITVMGESAGAFCVGALLAAPAAAGLFDKAILQSGSTGRVFDADTSLAIGADLLSTVGVADVDELRGVPGRRILDAQAAVIDRDIGRRNLPGGRAWGVVLDGSVVPEDPQTVVERGGAAHIPLLVTTTREEARLFEVLQADSFAPRDEDALLAEIRSAGIDDAAALLADYRAHLPAADLARLRSAFLTDVIYRWPARRLAAAQVAAGGRAYLALFTAEPFGPDLGACHASDLPYVFGSTAGSLFQLPDTPDHRAVGDQVIAAWAGFAATGDPGWNVYRPGADNTCRHFGATAEQGRPPRVDPPRVE